MNRRYLGGALVTAASVPPANCRGCHVRGQTNEWVFVGGYPSLRPEGVR
jgi:hypothetical protein